MKKEIILVTGSAGFIGSHLTRKLLKNGYRVVGIDNFCDFYPPLFKKENIADILTEKNFTLYNRDITNVDDLKLLFENHKIEKIVHLAAMAGVRPSMSQPSLYEKVNIAGTLNLLELAKSFRVKQVIFASSSSVYGEETETPFAEDFCCDRPVSLYAGTKRAAELFCFTYSKLYKIKTTILRFFTVYGPCGRPDMAPYLFTKSILEGETIKKFGEAESYRDFTYIDDIINGIIKALKKEYDFEIFNLGSGKPEKLNNFIKLIERLTKKKAAVEILPTQPGDVKQTFASTKKAKNLLEFKAKVSLEDGMKKFIDWYKEKRLSVPKKVSAQF